MFNWFKKKKAPELPSLQFDMHSHLLPGIDDGVKSLDDALSVIKELKKLGYQRLVTTPHVISDAYRNTPEIINGKLDELKSFLSARGEDIEIKAAAEYYLDEELLRMLREKQPLMTIGSNYLLFETNFLTEPFILKQFIFEASTQGYKLILAHPERYLYLLDNLDKVQDLLDRGVTFQINISSFTGYYSKGAQKMANQLVDRGWVHWLGTDCHHMNHVSLAREATKNKYFQKALTLPLLNYTM